MASTAEVLTKLCKDCGETKEITEFAPKRKSFSTYCRPCTKIRQRANYLKNHEARKEYGRNNHQKNLAENQRKARERQINKKYGLTLERYNEMLEEQGGVCKICGKVGGAKHMLTPLVVDHDHSCCPGETTCGNCVRGLLCAGCNAGIGFLRDDPNILMAAAAYLVQTEDILLKVGNL